MKWNPFFFLTLKTVVGKEQGFSTGEIDDRGK
jgi:hypothetical protein